MKGISYIAEDPDKHCAQSRSSNLVGIKVSRLNQTHTLYHKMLCLCKALTPYTAFQRCFPELDRNLKAVMFNQIHAMSAPDNMVGEVK